jgi:nucleoside phosphorylase
MAQPLSYSADLRLNFDPQRPQPRFAASLSAGALESVSALLPQDVPWPSALIPTPRPIAPSPAESDDLSRFAGYDAIIMTYTAAEAVALATLLTPGYPLSSWYEYRHNIADYLPIVTGKAAPFNDPRSPRYYHSLGLYFPCTIGTSRVLLMKSGLHLDHDLEAVGTIIPFSKMLTEVLGTVHPKVFITTGTGGAIGKEVLLGDVVIAGQTLFDCQHQFKNESFAHKSYSTTPISEQALALISPKLLHVNSTRIATATPIPGRATPKVWSGSTATIVTTDVFAYDTSNGEPYHLQKLGQACDMGDAMVGQVMEEFKLVSWYAIRNASDPQMPVPPDAPYKDPGDESDYIYATYGGITSAASIIASWAIVASSVTP